MVSDGYAMSNGQLLSLSSSSSLYVCFAKTKVVTVMLADRTELTMIDGSYGSSVRRSVFLWQVWLAESSSPRLDRVTALKSRLQSMSSPQSEESESSHSRDSRSSSEECSSCKDLGLRGSPVSS